VLTALNCTLRRGFSSGLRVHSLALISEAGHNVSDFLAHGPSFVAMWLQTRSATDERTFGDQRAGMLAGFVNALSLIRQSGRSSLYSSQEEGMALPRVMTCKSVIIELQELITH
jgi:divalent metal cation (Fe/Co/Zn/Cd) transporter